MGLRAKILGLVLLFLVVEWLLSVLELPFAIYMVASFLAGVFIGMAGVMVYAQERLL